MTTTRGVLTRMRQGALVGLLVGAGAVSFEGCSSSSAECGAGYTTCPGAGTCETELASNPDNCGACGNKCATGEACTLGKCGVSETMVICGTGQALCGGTACLNLDTDSTNCGGCGTICGTGTVCIGGACGATATGCAAAGEVYCDGLCQPASDSCNSKTCAAGEFSCGASCCANGSSCVDGQCMQAGRDASVMPSCEGADSSCSVDSECCSPLTCTDGVCAGAARSDAAVARDASFCTSDCCTVDTNCGPDETCQDGMCVGSSCLPMTCSDLGANCGNVGDGCGNVLDCGTCTVPDICGGGETNVCGPPP